MFDPLSPDRALPENDASVFAVQADLCDDNSVRRTVEIVLARYDRIDLVVNAAADMQLASLLDSPTICDLASRQFAVNVTAPLRLATVVAEMYWSAHELENRRERRNIVNITSVSAIQVFPHCGQAIYSASKAAFLLLSCHMSAEFASLGIRVNAIAPTAFPRLVSTDAVLDAIEQLDRGSDSGKTLVLDAAAE